MKIGRIARLLIPLAQTCKFPQSLQRQSPSITGRLHRRSTEIQPPVSSHRRSMCRTPIFPRNITPSSPYGTITSHTLSSRTTYSCTSGHHACGDGRCTSTTPALSLTPSRGTTSVRQWRYQGLTPTCRDAGEHESNVSTPRTVQTRHVSGVYSCQPIA